MTASPYIAVVGGVNIDIGGRSDAPLVAGDSNPGRIRSSLGGVGRNIAHNLALLGAKVKLITALGADDGAKRVEASCADLGIDLTDSLYVPDGATSTSAPTASWPSASSSPRSVGSRYRETLPASSV